MAIDKAEAEKEVLRRWRALPVSKRRTVDDAMGFAKVLAVEISFSTLGKADKIILGWLLRDLGGFDPPGQKLGSPLNNQSAAPMSLKRSPKE